MNNKGFIATSIIYSFFILFLTLFLGIIADYLQDKVLQNSIEQGIKEDNSFDYMDLNNGDNISLYINNNYIGDYKFNILYDNDYDNIFGVQLYDYNDYLYFKDFYNIKKISDNSYEFYLHISEVNNE